MIDNFSTDIEPLVAQFAASWDPDRQPLHRITEFLSTLDIGKHTEVPCAWLQKLAEHDLQQSWRNWHANIVHGGRLLSEGQLLQKLELLPTAATYRSLQCPSCEKTDWWNALVTFEAATRGQFGDARGPVYFQDLYGVETNVSLPKARQLRVKFEDSTKPGPSGFDVPLRGILKIGRQTTEDETLGWTERSHVTQVVIASAHERAFSRQQLTIRLLTPDHVLITNSGSGALPPNTPAKALSPGNSQLVTFPFMITLPGRKLVGS